MYISSPVSHMINEVLFEHVTPPLDGGQQSLFEWPGIDSEPPINDLRPLDLIHLSIDLLVTVDLFLEFLQCWRCLGHSLIT